MKPVPFDYVRPDTAEEALSLLHEHGGDALLMAGGMSLGPMLNLRLVKPSVVIDIGRIQGLDTIESGGGQVRTGATLRQSEALRHGELVGSVPLLGLALPWVGHVQTRNRGTLGGSVAHADPSAEIPLALTTLGGSVRLRSRRGRRTVPAEEFFLGMLTTARSPEEMVVGLDWHMAETDERFAFREIAQRHGDFAIAAVACRVRIENGEASGIAIGLGGVEDRPVRFEPRDVAGGRAGEDLAKAVAEDVAKRVSPLTDHTASAGQRRAFARTLIRQVLMDAFTDEQRVAA